MNSYRDDNESNDSTPSEFQVLIRAMQQLISSQNALTESIGDQTAKTKYTVSSNPKISIKIPIFKGEPNENVHAWLLQCHTIFEAQEINSSQSRIRYAATGLEGAALQWYLNKVAHASDEEKNAFAGWETFQKEIKTAFMPLNYQHHLRQQLRKLRQIGTVQEYGTQFRNIIGQISDIAELDKVTYFIEGLKPATKMEVAYQAPDNFEDAWALAIRFDTAMFSSRRDFSNKTSHRFTSTPKPSTLRNNGNNSEPIPMELDHIKASRFNNKKGTFKGNCYKCGTLGHIAKNCRVKKKTNLSNNEYTSSTSTSTPPTPSPAATNNSLELTQVGENKEQLLRFNGKINGYPAWILLDSGASKNFIDEKFVNKYKLITKSIPPLSVELVSGQELGINKSCEIQQLELGIYRTTNISTQVLPLQRYDLILGKPWFYHANPLINWRQNTLTFEYGSKVIKVTADTKSHYQTTSSCNSVFIS